MYKRKVQAIVAGTLWLVIVLAVSSRSVVAQGVGASIQGTVTDSTGAVIQGATVTVTNTETNLQRSMTSSSAGLYVVPNLPPGRYRMQVSMTGFQTNVRENIELSVGQELNINPVLQVGEITQQVTVTGEAPLVNTSTAQVSGLVGERQVKDLPLNGRSFDNLITLNPGTVNFTSMKQEASTSSGPGSNFSVSGRRPGENLFLMNGIEYPGASSAGSSTPGGASGQLLGIDAVREFNVVTSIDSAEYGHRTGGEINVVTASGTNSFHGTLFEFLRNSKLDARNFFDQGRIPPFRRNQFGAAAGGPIQKDKTFIFGNYEGFRERLGVSSLAVVPDLQARQGLLPDAQGVYRPVAGFNPAIKPYFPLWPEPNGAALLVNGLPTGTAFSFSNPNQSIREDFGTIRVDRSFSERDTLSGVYTVDDSTRSSPSSQSPFSMLFIGVRAQMISLTENHIVSPNVVNNFTAGFSRAFGADDQGVSISTTGMQPVVQGRTVAQLRIGGAGAGASAISVVGPGPGLTSNALTAQNLFTYEDQLHLTKNIHSITAGLWFERLQTNDNTLAVQYGQVVFPSLVSFLQGKPSQFQVALTPNTIPWRSWMGAWYVQDSMKLRPNLTLSLGVRHEFTNGWNALLQRASNYIPGPNGVLRTAPQVGSGVFTKNNAHWLFGPRAGLAWDPFGRGKTSINAGFGIAYNLLDNIGWCCSATLPANTRFSIVPPPDFPLPAPLVPGGPVPPGAAPGGGGGGGIQSDAKTPTVINYRFSIEQELPGKMATHIAYVGSRGYHDLLQADANTVIPAICSAASGNCPAGLPDGSKYFPAGRPRRNPALASMQQMFSSAVSYYNSFQIDLNRRFGSGLMFRTNYTFSKSMDNSSSLTAFQAIGNPQTVLDPEDRFRDLALSAFDSRHRFAFSGSYELPFGAGKSYLSGSRSIAEGLVGGWQVNGIVSLQAGFPFTPQLGFIQSRNGNSNAADRPDMAPGRTLQGIYPGTPNRWYDPAAFALPVAGTYGNAGRNVLIGPGVAGTDLSIFKTTRISEKLSTQFRAEFFNLFNRSNFGLPSPIVMTPDGKPAPAAGVVTKTSTTSRQIQFGLKLIW